MNDEIRLLLDCCHPRTPKFQVCLWAVRLEQQNQPLNAEEATFEFCSALKLRCGVLLGRCPSHSQMFLFHAYCGNICRLIISPRFTGTLRDCPEDTVLDLRFDMEHLRCNHFRLSMLSLRKDSLSQLFPWEEVLYEMLDIVNIDLLTLLTFVQEHSWYERESTARLVCAKTNCCHHAISVTCIASLHKIAESRCALCESPRQKIA